MSVVKTISLPSGDHDALDTERVKYRSSIGMGRAFGLVAETIVLASVIGRVSGPEDWAAAKMQAKRRARQVIDRDFITTSLITDIGQNSTRNLRSELYTGAGLTLVPGVREGVNHRGHK